MLGGSAGGCATIYLTPSKGLHAFLYWNEIGAYSSATDGVMGVPAEELLDDLEE